MENHPKEGETYSDKGDLSARAQRHLAFEGIQNFRDLGGYQTRDGRTVKWGMLFRSGQLSELTNKDHASFKDLGIQLICDFRWEAEQRQAPNNLPDSDQPNIQSLPIKTGSFRSFLEKNGKEHPGPEDMMAAMKEIYRDFVNDHAQTYATMFQRMLQADRGTTLIHCSAGKDRTGFGSAMILYALGVDREVIMNDYLLSAKYFSADSAMEMLLKNSENTKRFPFDLNAFRPVYEVYPEYLETALGEIEQKYASVERYLEEALGMTREIRKHLQEKYLEKP
ncbi:MAG: tyrosine-protein phosphatase [Proteobacteria bacterium]|nr:tyrosine-protein phosphatase [Pseudomonadota bacterium]MBU4469292.1 tyrosine-protein phosphatase [Pseudomonadota bacterium]MCG2750771.1 tyrosine-protein phosphatase [Desulfobacteraceae bacterium]